jgi:aldehyde:ferredoxin oxidoreductase
MLGGYMGKLLFVDLSEGSIWEEELEDELCHSYLGGYGVGARLLYSRQRGGVDALAPEAIIGFLTGPLTGTPALLGSRYVIVAKSPLTKGWGDSNSGGYFGPYLKFAGYDGVFFRGISEKPVYLLIDDGNAEIGDASHLWGKDTFEVQDIMKQELGDETGVSCIGPAGEKLSLLASVMHDKGRAAGRSGMGAVMGSKKLKAIVVRGRREVPLADKERIKSIRREQLRFITGPIVDSLKTFGTTKRTAEWALSGRSVCKNWAGVAEIDFPNVKNLEGARLLKYKASNYGCWRCPIRCGGRLKVGLGEYKWEAGIHTPEYETLAAFGTRCLNSNLESIIKESDICNRYGLDTISTGAVLAFAIECYENGIITKKDTDGVELKWGNHRAHVTMVERLARREGFGDVLADGIRIAAQHIGGGAAEYAVHLGGQEPSAQDPKECPGMATTFLMDATPGRHTQGGSRELERGEVIPGIYSKPLKPYVYTGKGEGHKKMSAFRHVVQAAGVCYLGYSGVTGEAGNAKYLVDSLNAVTGGDYSIEELLKVGDRIATIRRAFNIREGINPLEFKVPGRMIGDPPMDQGPLAGITVDLDAQVKDYLKAMDWDFKMAKPSRQVLLSLGLDDIANELWG